jgi:putative DNA primase/helicase
MPYNPDFNGGATAGVLDHALAYLQAEFSVLPIRADGSKAPALTSWDDYKARRPAEAELRAWFAVSRPLGLGLVGGAVSKGLLVVDVEFLDFFDEWFALVDAQAPGLVACLPQVRTPGKDQAGGRHVYVRTGGAPVPTGKLARMTRAEAERRTGDAGKTTAIEVKAEKGYVLTVGCPAACHPSGRLYEHIGGPPIERTPTLAEAEVNLLLACARALERGDKASADRQQAAQNGAADELRPGDDFNRRADWRADVLGSGWRTVRESGEVLYLSRPGKDAGVSATIGYCKSERAGPKLYVFSTNAEPFESEKSYSKFEAYAVLYHAGDFRAAARELGRLGYGARRGTARAAADSAGPPPRQAGEADARPGANAAEIILAYWQERFEPTFRRGPGVYSAREGRVIRSGDAGPDFELIDRLAGAADAPRSKHGVDRDKLPALFETWRGVAWGELLREMPTEPEAGEIADAAADEFRRQVAGALYRIVTMGRDVDVGGQRVQRQEQRSLLQWCDLWAQAGRRWVSVRGYALWCRRNANTKALEIAFRQELFAQVGPPELARLKQAELSGLSAQYGVGSPARAGGAWAVVLTAAFVGQLLARPADEVDAVDVDDPGNVNSNSLCPNVVDAVDGVDAPHACAGATPSTASTPSTRAPGGHAHASEHHAGAGTYANGDVDVGVDAGVDATIFQQAGASTRPAGHQQDGEVGW